MKRNIAALLIVLLVCGVLAALLWPTPQRNAVASVKALDGSYREEYEDGRKLVVVLLIERPVTDDDLITLRDIRPLHRLFLDSTKVTDEGLVHLEAIEGLEWVSLCKTAVTDEGMVHLRRIPNLRW